MKNKTKRIIIGTLGTIGIIAGVIGIIILVYKIVISYI